MDARYKELMLDVKPYKRERDLDELIIQLEGKLEEVHYKADEATAPTTATPPLTTATPVITSKTRVDVKPEHYRSQLKLKTQSRVSSASGEDLTLPKVCGLQP